MDHEELLDTNLYKIIVRCYINQRTSNKSSVSVIYEDGVQENIWTFNHNKESFERHEFIGKTKIEAVFLCDRKRFIRNTYDIL